MTSNVCQQGYLRLIGGIVLAWPVTPGVAGSSPVHSATNSKAQTNLWAFLFEFYPVFLDLRMIIK